MGQNVYLTMLFLTVAATFASDKAKCHHFGKQLACKGYRLPEMKAGNFPVNDSSLADLYVVNAELFSMEYNVFHEMADLKILDLRYNMIESLDHRLFIKSFKLTHLHLGHNKLQYLADSRLFLHQRRLVQLDLSMNEITYLNSSVLDPLKSIKLIKLSGNSFDCSCELEHFKYLIDQEVIMSNLTCRRSSSPTVIPWSRLNDFTTCSKLSNNLTNHNYIHVNNSTVLTEVTSKKIEISLWVIILITILLTVFLVVTVSISLKMYFCKNTQNNSVFPSENLYCEPASANGVPSAPPYTTSVSHQQLNYVLDKNGQSSVEIYRKNFPAHFNSAERSENGGVPSYYEIVEMKELPRNYVHSDASTNYDVPRSDYRVPCRKPSINMPTPSDTSGCQVTNKPPTFSSKANNYVTQRVANKETCQKQSEINTNSLSAYGCGVAEVDGYTWLVQNKPSSIESTSCGGTAPKTIPRAPLVTRKCESEKKILAEENEYVVQNVCPLIRTPKKKPGTENLYENSSKDFENVGSVLMVKPGNQSSVVQVFIENLQEELYVPMRAKTSPSDETNEIQKQKCQKQKSPGGNYEHFIPSA